MGEFPSRVITIVLTDQDVPEVYVDGITIWAVPAILQAVLDTAEHMPMAGDYVRWIRPEFVISYDEDDEDDEGDQA